MNGTQNAPNCNPVHRPLSYHPILRCLCNKGFTGLTCYEKKVHHVKILARCGMLRHAAARCGTLRHAAACCGMLRHAAACCGMLRHAAACCGMLRHAAACFKTPTNSSQNLALRHAAAVGACWRFQNDDGRHPPESLWQSNRTSGITQSCDTNCPDCSTKRRQAPSQSVHHKETRREAPAKMRSQVRIVAWRRCLDKGGWQAMPKDTAQGTG